MAVLELLLPAFVAGLILSFSAFTLFGVWLLLVWWRRRELPEGRWFLRVVAALGPLSVVALISGWVTTEVGRMRWFVSVVMRTRDAVTSND